MTMSAFSFQCSLKEYVAVHYDTMNFDFFQNLLRSRSSGDFQLSDELAGS